MSFPAYGDYKESGVRWLGRIPKHWDIVQSRRMFCVRNEGAQESDRQVTASQQYGILYQDEFVALEGRKVVETLKGVHTLRRVKPNDFVISLRSFQGGIEWSKIEGAITFHYVVLTPIKHVYEPFFAHLFKSMAYIQALRSTTNLIRDGQDLRFSHFVQVDLPIIPFDEQQAIASFLDVETSKIDSLVAEQRRLIELLKEKRQAVISHAVTKGLNPNAPMKPSGIQWLGDVPEHWGIASVRRVLAEIEQGWSPQCDSRPAEGDEWGILKTGCVNRGIFSENENKALPKHLEPIVEYEVKPGDVLMSRASGSPDLVGATAFVYEVRPNLMLSDKTFRIHLAQTMEPKFFVSVFNSQLMRAQIEQSISGAEGLANNLPQSKLKCFALALPPIDEQLEIVRELGLRCQRFDMLQAEAERAIELLQERRTALISAAVTGKIDVRGYSVREVA